MMGRGSTVLDVRALPDRADDRRVSHFVTHGLYQRTANITSSLRQVTRNGIMEGSQHLKLAEILLLRTQCLCRQEPVIWPQ